MRVRVVDVIGGGGRVVDVAPHGFTCKDFTQTVVTHAMISLATMSTVMMSLVMVSFGHGVTEVRHHWPWLHLGVASLAMVSLERAPGMHGNTGVVSMAIVPNAGHGMTDVWCY